MINLTRAEKAIKIAIHEGWREKTHDEIEKAINSNGWCEKYENPQTYAPYHDLDETDLVEKYSSFNGLMPIVERVNKADGLNGFEISHFEITIYNQITHRHFELEGVDLIDCLQDAIIYYYENKEV